MANIKSQKKRILTNEKARQRNKAVKSSLKTSVRKFNAAAEAGDADQATALARKASRKLDKAASKGVIHKNQAANRKSAIAQRAASLYRGTPRVRRICAAWRGRRSAGIYSSGRYPAVPVSSADPGTETD